MPRHSLILITVEQGPIVLALGVDGGCVDTFFLPVKSLVFLNFSGTRLSID